MNKNTKIIIWGADDSNTLGLLRQLRVYSNEILTIFQGRRNFVASCSKYCKKYLFTRDYDNAIQYLLENFSDSLIKPFLIASTDLVAETVDQHLELLSKSFYIMGTRKSLVLTQILDKFAMGKLAQRVGLFIPSSYIVHKYSDITHIKYPCLIKPYKNDKIRKKEFKTKVCLNEHELSETLSQVNEKSVFVVQDYIEKEYDILIYGCRLYNGQIIMPGHFKKDRWYKQADGSHGYIKNGIPPQVDSTKIANFLREIEYYGLFSFEFGVKNEIAYFYEVNLRNDGTSHYFFQAGINIPYLWVNQFSEDFNSNMVYGCINEQFIDEINDVSNVGCNLLTKEKWKKQMKEANVFRYYDRSDKRPYFIQKYVRIIKTILSPIKPILLRFIR